MAICGARLSAPRDPGHRRAGRSALVALFVVTVGSFAPAAGSAAVSSPRSCAPGHVVAHHIYRTKHGTFLADITTGVEPETGNYYACVRPPNGHVKTAGGVVAFRFRGGSYFRRDVIRHIFMKVSYGTMNSFEVFVPRGRAVQLYGPYIGSIIQYRDKPFALRIAHNDCKPDCASAHVTHTTLTWHSKSRTYS